MLTWIVRWRWLYTDGTGMKGMFFEKTVRVPAPPQIGWEFPGPLGRVGKIAHVRVDDVGGRFVAWLLDYSERWPIGFQPEAIVREMAPHGWEAQSVPGVVPDGWFKVPGMEATQ